VKKFSHERGRRPGWMNKVQEDIQSEDDEDKPEQKAGDEGGDFHGFIFWGLVFSMFYFVRDQSRSKIRT
jgi:hypothetical protein